MNGAPASVGGNAKADHTTVFVAPAVPRTGEKQEEVLQKWSLFKKKGDKKKNDDEEEENKEEDVKPPVPMTQMFRYANLKERSLIFLGLLAATVAGLCMPAMIILFGDITNAFVYSDLDINITAIAAQLNKSEDYVNATLQDHMPGDFFTQVMRFGAGTAIIGGIQLLTGYVFVTCLNYAAEGQVHRIRTQFLRATMRQEMGWFDTHKTNDFASKVTEDLNKLQEGIGEKIGMFVFFFVTFIASLINAFVHGWELTLVIMSVFPLLGITSGIMAKIQSSLTSREMAEYAKAGSIAEEVMGGIRTVLAFGGQEKEVKRYESNLIHARAAGIKRGLFTGISMGLVWLIIYASYSIAFWYGTGLILESRYPNDGEYDPATLIVVFFSVLMGAMNMGQAAPFMEAFNIARGAAANVYEVLERPSLIDPYSEEGIRPKDTNGFIEFRNVHFSYPARPDVKVLQGLNLQVRPGQTVALVGSSGCGKSTCVQLMQRFYDPANGSVLLDSVPLHEHNIGWLRDQVGVVGQEPVLFATTIENNIRYGRDGLSFDQVVAAAREANAHDFIMKMPKQYQTQVGERGSQMSGGQKQRIAIARALVKQPRILLLDEATSALDNQSEAVVQNALDKARQGRSTIIVAHRLTTIRSADLIVAMQDGRAAEMGTHEQLMVKHGLYYSLVTAQIAPGDRKSVIHEELSAGSEYETAPELEQHDILEELTSAAPMALARVPSMRSQRRRRTSSGSVRSRSSRGQQHRIATIRSVEKQKKEKPPEMPMLEIIKANKTEWHYITLGVIGSVVQGCCMPLYAVLFGDVLGTLSLADPDEARSEANFYALLFLGIGVLAAVSVFTQSYSFSISGEILTMRLRSRAFSAMLRQEMGWFDQDDNSVGALCSRLSGDAAAVQGATGSRLGTIMQALATLGLSMGLAMYYDWRLGLVCVPFIPFVLVAMYLQAKMLTGQSITESEVLLEAGKIALEAIGNVRTVASLHREEQFSMAYEEALEKPHLIALKHSHLRGAAFGFAQCVPFLAYSVVMLYGGYLVENDNMPYENVFKVAEALILGTMMVGQAVAFAPNYSKGKVAAARIFRLLERVPAIDSSASVGRVLDEDFNEVKLEEVHFKYPSRADTPILQGLSLSVHRGQTIALVGPSGCGKSTVISLIERFYDPDKGKLTINNHDLQQLNVGSVRRGVGLVSQEPQLFDLTIAENIAYGDNSREVPQSEVAMAAKLANISTFIESLPNGYNTRVGAKGTQLSGGQKQRIAIARALVRNPNVLMLDEATSALDTESEAVVQEALDAAQKGRTSIVIAHRLSTIQGADVIAVISGGRLVETGTHHELLGLRGHYYRLYQTNRGPNLNQRRRMVSKGEAVIKEFMRFKVHMEGSMNGHEFEIEGEGEGRPYEGTQTAKLKVTKGGPLPFSWDILSPQFMYGSRAFIKHPADIPDYYKQSFPEGFKWERVMNFEDGGAVTVTQDTSLEDGTLIYKVKLRGTNFPPDGPVMQKKTMGWEASTERLYPEDGVLKGDIKMALRLKDGGRYLADFKTTYKAKKPVQMPGAYNVDRKLDITSHNEDYTVVEQYERSEGRHSTGGMDELYK
nr:ABCB1-mScarlet-I fusion protein [Vector pPB-pCoBlast-actin5c-abcb1(67-1411)-mScI]